MYTDTVTIFNRSGTDKEGFAWYATILENVDLIVDKGANIVKTGLDSADTAKLHVKCITTNGVVKVGDNTYLTPKIWLAQDDFDGTLTFQSGVDFFIRGEWDGENTIANEEYSKNGFYSYCNSRYDICHMITTVGGPYKVIPHFEIGGK